MNRILGADGQPAGGPRVATARISGRESLDHEPRDVVIEVETVLPSFEALKRLAGLVNDGQLALGPWTTWRAPVAKVRIFVDRDRVAQAFGYAKAVAALGGGEVTHQFEKEKPGAEPGAETGESSTPG